MSTEQQPSTPPRGSESPSSSSSKVHENGTARPRNFLVPTALLTLREMNSYGYALIEQMARFGFEAMNPGTLYRTLRQMEKEGLCESEWETNEGGPARRIYSITDVGEAYLEFWAEALEQYRRNMDTFFEVYRGLGATNGYYKENNKKRARGSRGIIG